MWAGPVKNADFLSYYMDYLQGIIETQISVKLELLFHLFYCLIL